MLESFFIFLSGFLILLSLLPFIQHQHWLFRVPEFLKLQILLIQLIVWPLTFWFTRMNVWVGIMQFTQFILIVYHLYILARYTKFWRKSAVSPGRKPSEKVKVISCNIYQFNREHQRFIDLIQREQPDIFLTMESNGAWEEAMRVLEKDYPFHEKVTLENTYGMHFYTKLKIRHVQTHYFVADDLPSIEAELETPDGQRFIFFGVHPPPPSPTEEETSKERDGDLLSVAKKVRKASLPVLVTGDFNSVAWARASLLFRKTSALIDARIGRGILSTFHARYWFFRVPLDLLFHSTDIFIDRLFIYPSIGSDHFPIGCEFHIDTSSSRQEQDVEYLEKSEMEEVNDLIAEGKAEESGNRKEGG